MVDVANATTESSNCVPVSTGRNLWNLCLFFGANVFAHAATIHPRTGATAMNSFRRVLFMLVAPITAGTVATYAIITFILGVKKFGIKWVLFRDGKESLQSAIPAGAVAISIPRELAPVLAGRWKLVGDDRYSLSLDRQQLSEKSKQPQLPTADAKLDFILPPHSRLPGYTNYKFYPASNFTNEFIAVVQLVYGIYQLVNEYSSTFQWLGLSSPYVFAIPYLFMSLVNLVANIVMPSYSHVVILSPLQTSTPMNSTAVLTATLNANTSKDLENASSGQFMRRFIWHIGKRYRWQENKWDERYMSISTRRGEIPETDGHTKVQRKILLQQTNPQLAFITWTGKGWFGTIEKSWSRECSPSVELERELELWLKLHYPDVETSIHARPLRIYQLSRYLSVLVSLIVTTAFLGALTQFRIRVSEFGARNLYFIYLPQTMFLVPFIVLASRKTSVGFYTAIEILSSYTSTSILLPDFRNVNSWMINACITGAVLVAIALWQLGNCMCIHEHANGRHCIGKA